ncbi:MAG: hypothetical protein JWP57_4366 [Spirosoma sp.]|nr:hypothetical protein [Spirosoma sp.]
MSSTMISRPASSVPAERRAPSDVSYVLGAPVMTADLGHAVDAAWNFGVKAPPPPARVREARAVLPVLQDRLAAPTSPAVIRAWLMGVATACNNPPAEGDFLARLASVVEASSDLPECVWTVDNRRAFIRAGGSKFFWPGAGEVDEFLRGKLNELTRQREGLLRVATFGQSQAAAPEPAGVKPASVVERDAILAKFRGDFAQAMEPVREAAARPAGKMRVEPRPLSAGHLAKLRDENPLVQAARSMTAELDEEKRAREDW